MSSSGVSGVIQRGKLLVHIAENGHSFELEIDEYTLVETIQRYLESLSGINLNDQLLLYLDMKLEPHQPLSAYKLPSNNQEVYLYNKSKMRTNAPPPEPEKINISGNALPKPSSTHDPHPLDEASDPALKALPSYEREFRYHFQLGNTIYHTTVARYETCERLSTQQRVQEKALEIARGNLDHFYRLILQNYNDFVKCYSLQQRQHSNLLVNFWRDLERLRSIKLIPVLQTNNRKCLSDFIKEENLTKMVEDCGNSHRQFESKVGEFKQEFRELKCSTEHLFSSQASINHKDLEKTIKDHRQYIIEQKSIIQALSKDVTLVKKLVDDCLTSQLSTSLRPHNAVSALGPMYEGHDKNYLPKMQTCERAILNLLIFCKEKKTEMNNFVHSYMQKIAYIQYTIKDIRYKFSLFTEALKRQNEQFENLKIVRGIGPAYRACLAEIVRRKAAMKLYMGMAGQLAERLGAKREIEVRRREEFVKVHSLFIPRDVLSLMGLYDTPSLVEVNVAPFDSNLLDVNISDLDRFAPECLSGLFKTEMSNDEGLELSEVVGTGGLEVENAKLKAELASAIARLCFYPPELELDEGETVNLLKNGAEKTAQALRLKDEYGKQLESVLREKEIRCKSYEKRIKELEQRLSEANMAMDEASYASSSLLAKNGKVLDDNLTDLDSSMRETDRNECNVNEKDDKEVTGMPLMASSSGDNISEVTKTCEDVKERLSETEEKLLEALEAVGRLGVDLETNRSLLDESQMNCAHLENCLHEAREEAQTHLCAADRRASEYNALRGSALKLQCLFERLKTCVSSVGIAGFAESLHSLAQSLANSENENGDDGTGEFRECVQVLAKKVGILARHWAELIDRYTKAESAHEQLLKDLDEKKELVNTLYMKHQSEKQANKERISFGRLELHEIAAFILNRAGHYEAINRSSTHYYLSSESTQLYAAHLPTRPAYIVGQIVHIERQTVKPSATTLVQAKTSRGSTDGNPYGLAVGCEYFVVTVAMLPGAAVNPPPDAAS